MPIYNTERTAYKRSWSDNWYLVPEGMTRAPRLFFLFGEGPFIRTNHRYRRLSEEHINLITKKDRVVLLEATNAGCFDDMWDEMMDVLQERGKNNMKKLMKFVER